MLVLLTGTRTVIRSNHLEITAMICYNEVQDGLLPQEQYQS